MQDQQVSWWRRTVAALRLKVITTSLYSVHNVHFTIPTEGWQEPVLVDMSGHMFALLWLGKSKVELAVHTNTDAWVAAWFAGCVARLMPVTVVGTFMPSGNTKTSSKLTLVKEP